MRAYKVLCVIRNKLLLKVAETEEYRESWDNDFKDSQRHELYEGLLKQEVSQVDIHELTVEQMKDLGFSEWSENEPGFYLIPLWMKPFIKDGTPVKSIGGDIYAYDVRHEDNDHRFGALAIGIVKGE
jgi:hypothetical protein